MKKVKYEKQEKPVKKDAKKVENHTIDMNNTKTKIKKKGNK